MDGRTLGAFVNTMANNVLAERTRVAADPSMPRTVILWDPAVVMPEEYAELVTILGDLARAAGAAGITRVASEAFGDQSTGLAATT